MKVYEIMEQFESLRFVIFATGGVKLFEGYRAVCCSCFQNLWIEHYHVFSKENTAIIFVY